MGGAGADSLTGGEGADSILGGAGADVLDGGAGNDYLDGGAGNDSLVGGEGDDILVAGAGNDTLTGGDGNDVYVYSGGKDVIADYAEGDYISIPSGSVSASTISGGDVIMTVGSKGTITIKNGKNSEITVANATSTVKGIFGYYSYARSTAGGKVDSIAVNEEFAGTLNATMYASTVATIDATAVTNDVVIYGNAIANTIFGSTKNESETIYAGDGNDSVEATSGNEAIYGEAGNDTIVTGGGNDTIYGGDGLDSIVAGDGDNIISGGAGNDSVYVGSGNDSIDGGEGNDYIEAGAGNDTVSAGAGNDTVIVTSGDNYISGGAGNDSLVGGSGSDTFNGGEGNDTIYHTGGDDFIENYSNVSGNADVIYLGESGSVASSELNGNDVVLNVENGGTITIKDGKNSAIKVANNEGTTEQIYGYFIYDEANTAITLNSNFEGTLPASLYPAKTKTIDATRVNTTSNEPLVVYGNSNDNTIQGSTIMANVLYGEAGKDYLVGGNDGDTLVGGAGNDSLDGGAGDDSLVGGLGNDYLDGGSGDDTIDGGDGVDTIVYSGGNDVILNYEASKDVIFYGGGDSEYAIKGSSINGSDVTITMTDGSHDGSITIVNGKDKKIILTNEDDYSGKGDIYGYYLGVGSDSVTLNSDFAANAFAAKTYRSTISLIDASLLEDGKNISITGTDQESTIIGSDNNDSIYGGKGADSILAGGGNNVVSGGAGADYIEGGEGNDKLAGDAGDDTLIGGGGTDTLTGGAGADVFVYVSESDVITDYEAGKDSIIISGTAVSSSTITGNDVVLDMGGGTVTVQKGKDKVLTIIQGSEDEGTVAVSGIFGYFDGVGQETITINSAFTGKELTSKMYSSATLNADPVVVNAIDGSSFDSDITIYANTAAATSIKSGNGNTTLVGTSNNDTLIGGEGNNVIIGTGGNNYMDSGVDGSATISGGTGNDTLISTDGNNSLSGGSGEDTFLFVGGTATISDYRSGEDTIQFTAEGVSVESSNVTGDDVLLDIGAKGSILVQGAKGKALTILDYEGNGDSRVYGYFNYEEAGDGAAITLNADYPNADVRDAIYGSSVTTINASLVTKGLAIYANSNAEGTYVIGSGNNDSLVGASGRNDTLIGGDGYDTLIGTSGNNTFVHTAGNDVIADYTYDGSRQDTIDLSDSAVQSASVTGNDVVITTTGGGTVTVKNAKDKQIAIISNGTAAEPRIYGYYDYDNDNENYIRLNDNFTGTFNASVSAPEAEVVDGSAVTAGITITSAHESDGNSIMMIGGEGNDKIIASNNGDTLSGYDGTDTLVGGTGEDFYRLQLEDVINNHDDWQIRHRLECNAAYSRTDGKDVELNPAGGKITVKNAKNSKLDALLRRRDGKNQTRPLVLLELRRRYTRLIRQQRLQWLNPLSLIPPPRFDRTVFTATSMATMATAYAVYPLDLENSIVYGVDSYGNVAAIECGTRAARASTCRTLDACGVPRVDWAADPYIVLEVADPLIYSDDEDEG